MFFLSQVNFRTQDNLFRLFAGDSYITYNSYCSGCSYNAQNSSSNSLNLWQSFPDSVLVLGYPWLAGWLPAADVLLRTGSSQELTSVWEEREEPPGLGALTVGKAVRTAP